MRTIWGKDFLWLTSPRRSPHGAGGSAERDLPLS